MVKIEFKTGNAAFEEDWEGSVEFITEQIKNALLNKSDKNIRDINGNTVGTIAINI